MSYEQYKKPTASAPQSNYAASAAPAVTDDTSEGYEVGSVWIDTTADERYVCLDASEGAAVWAKSTVGTAAEVVNTPAGSIAATTVQAAVNELDTDLTAHKDDSANPHTVTKTQIGLSNVDNTSDANKPVSTAQQTALDLKADKSASLNTQTDSYTLVLGDAGKVIQMNKGTANTLTVPLNSAVAFPTGTRILIIQIGAGSTTIAATGGVTINAPASVALEIAEQHGSRGLLKVDTDTWQLI